MKNLYIHCDGGFGNRFNSLVVGLLICERGNFNPIISWPSTNVCRAFYGDIFEEQFESISNRLEDYSDSIDEFEFVMHDNQLSWNPCHPPACVPPTAPTTRSLKQRELLLQ